jgi:hypothetical protein
VAAVIADFTIGNIYEIFRLAFGAFKVLSIDFDEAEIRLH